MKWKLGCCQWEIKIGFHTEEAASAVHDALPAYMRATFQVDHTLLSSYHRGIISNTDAYCYPLGLFH